MAGHTAGPWNIDGQFDAEVAVGIYAGDMEGEWTGICELEPLLGEWTEEEIANARLLAAAPDLLRTLKEVGQMADDEVQRPGDNDQRFRALKRIRNFVRSCPAIAKAEGRSTQDVAEAERASR